MIILRKNHINEYIVEIVGIGQHNEMEHEMIATRQDLIIDQGAVYHEEFVLLDANNEPLNVDGMTAQSQMRRSYESANAIAISCALTNGNLSHDMSANATRNIEAGRYLYDIEITTPESKTIRLFEGVDFCNA
jgi:hypothetical protein